MVKGAVSLITQLAVAQLDSYNLTLPVKHLSWTHNLVLMKQVKDIRVRYGYMVQSIANHWTTRYLQEAIKLDHYGKHGALANNFTETLPASEAGSISVVPLWMIFFAVRGTAELSVFCSAGPRTELKPNMPCTILRSQ